MGIFADNARKYFELGIPVIPLAGKMPVKSGWAIYSERMQTEDELELLIADYPNANIGAVLGLWACALDIDTDDQDVGREPNYTPLRRRGAKGEVRLYAPMNWDNKPQSKYPIEFLNKGRQIVLPPSIHPDTNKPYIWTGEHLGWDVIKNLPPFSKDSFLRMEALCEKKGIYSKAQSRRNQTPESIVLTDVGRNNHLTRMAYAMACDGVSEKEGIDRLLKFDYKEHEVPWFSDPTEPHKGKDPKKNATKMYQRALASAKKNGDYTVFKDIDIDLKKKKPTSKYPDPRGFMRLFRDYCETNSRGAQDALGLGGAIALMAAICSNRFITVAGEHTIWPNMFIINLAASGFGKETPQRAIDALLVNTRLLGAASYKSGSSIVMDLPKQQERLDLIDECSALLKSMTSKEDYKSEIVEILSSLYSKSNGKFLGMSSRADGARFGACWNPCVNILGSTTPTGFKSSVNREMAAKGLMPRFLVFYQEELGQFKETFDEKLSDNLFKSCKSFVDKIMRVEKREAEVEKNLIADGGEETKKYNPILIPMTPAAQALLTQIAKTYFEIGSGNPEGFESAFQQRFAQHVSKLALIDAVSMGMSEITTDSIEWAHEVVKAQWNAAQPLYELAHAENDNHKLILRCKRILREHGVMTKRDFSKSTQWLYSKRQRDDILNSLKEAGEIKIGTGLSKTARGDKTFIVHCCHPSFNENMDT